MSTSVKMRAGRTVTLCLLQVCTAVCALSGYHEAIGVPEAYHVRGLERASRVIGGRPVSMIQKYSYKAGIICTLSTGRTSLCGGALISNTRVLTAAHCWYDGQHQAHQFTVVLGSLTVFSGGTRINTSDVIVHQSWNADDIVNDIAMAKIPFVIYNGNIQAISLPASSDIGQTFAGFSAIATGFGKTSDSQSTFPSTTTLHDITLKILKNVACQDSFTVKLHSSQLCTSGNFGTGTCDGDSGGPLTVIWKNKRILVGIISFGFGNGCSAGYPSVYTRVTSFLTWIQTHI